MSVFRKALCCMITTLLVMPASLLAADTNAAMLYARGTAWVNGANIPRSSALFPGDLVQTKSDSVANINLLGSNVTVLSDSLVKFEGNSLEVEHGGVTVATSRNLATHLGDVTVTPASGSWTEFQVADVDGNVKIMARKGDVTISDESGTSTLPAGQETTREAAQKSKKRRKAGAAPAAQGAILDSKTAIIIGTAAVGGVTAWVLLQGDDPASPATF
ncbi:MAG: hypothetical protein DMG68_10305 [Acidobacteria bacterium]|jgi:hypothetical protein|nr:MAG: hypothetical protein DMG68_10305 [Acidobacteriota bacterium]